MKHLNEYFDDDISTCLKKHGAFFCFSKSQFEEGRTEGVIYVDMGGGLVCPKENAAAYNKESDDIIIAAIAQDVSDNGIEGIIRRELNNHEAYYTRDISSTVDALVCYDITADQVRQVFIHNKLKNDDN